MKLSASGCLFRILEYGFKIKKKNTKTEQKNKEIEIFEAHPSRWNYFWNYALGWILLFIPTIIATLSVKHTKIEIDNKYLKHSWGIFSVNEDEIEINRIRTVKVRQSFGQRIFGLGNIFIATSGTGGYDIKFFGFKNPKGIAQLLKDRRKD